MAFVSVTRLKVKSLRYLLPFLRANEASAKEIVQTAGFIAGKELVDKGLVFWTLSIWNDEQCMKQFRNGEAHRKAMQQLPVWCNEASYTHWLQEEVVLPEWLQASSRLLEEGKLTKVRHPSKRQVANNFPPIKWQRMQRVFQ